MYTATVLKNEFAVKKIYTLHYFEYSKNFIFSGEKHNFWEFLYVDKGEVEIIADDRTFCVKQGDAVFHKPEEWHNVRANGNIAPNIIVVSFECKNSAMNFFKEKTLSLSNEEKIILGNILQEGRNAFSTSQDDPYVKKLTRQEKAFASEQLVRLYIEQLLISLYRNNTVPRPVHSALKQKLDGEILEDVKNFLKENVSQKLKFSEVCEYSKTSSTALKTIFAKGMGMGVMEYFTMLKIERAKQYIREESLNFTQISRELSYDSVHYFSRQFKQKTGMTPTEYANSVQLIVDRAAVEE